MRAGCWHAFTGSPSKNESTPRLKLLHCSDYCHSCKANTTAQAHPTVVSPQHWEHSTRCTGKTRPVSCAQQCESLLPCSKNSTRSRKHIRQQHKHLPSTRTVKQPQHSVEAKSHLTAIARDTGRASCNSSRATQVRSLH